MVLAGSRLYTKKYRTVPTTDYLQELQHDLGGGHTPKTKKRRRRRISAGLSYDSEWIVDNTNYIAGVRLRFRPTG